MADNKQKFLTREEIAKINPRYKGDPKNFKQDFAHPKREERPPAPDKREEKHNKGQKQPSKQLPAATQKTDKPSAPVIKESPMFLDSIFTPHITVRENQRRTAFTPTLVQIGPLVDETWNILSTRNEQIAKRLTFESFRYYCAALTWARIIFLKNSTNQTLTQEELLVREQIANLDLSIPDPIYQFLHIFGEVTGFGVGQTMQPHFPALPNRNIGNIGGFFGPLGGMNQNHLLYEEIPSLGVAAEAICQSLNLNQAPGVRYASAVALVGTQANENMLGYRPLSYRRNEAIDFLIRNGVTQNAFPSTVLGTAFNTQIVKTISEIVASLNGFKSHAVQFSKLSSVGTSAQLTISRPVNMAGGPRPVMCANAEVRTTAMGAYPDLTFGIAQFGTPQLMKENSVDPALEDAVRTWVCLDFTNLVPIPAAWLAQRNARRNLPAEYNAERFEVISQDLQSLRTTTLHAMAKNIKD